VIGRPAAVGGEFLEGLDAQFAQRVDHRAGVAPQPAVGPRQLPRRAHDAHPVADGVQQHGRLLDDHPALQREKIGGLRQHRVEVTIPHGRQGAVQLLGDVDVEVSPEEIQRALGFQGRTVQHQQLLKLRPRRHRWGRPRPICIVPKV